MPHAVVIVPISLAWILDVGTMTTSRVSSWRRLDSATTNHLFTQSPTLGSEAGGRCNMQGGPP